MVALMMIIDLIVVVGVLGLTRDHELSVRRLETIEAEYAAEAGTNMSIREMMYRSDDDGDGTVGTISDDGDSGNDPSLGVARFVVTASADDPVAGQTTLTSEGRSGAARRKMSAILE